MKQALRKEMKYILSAEKALEIQSSLEGVLQRDAFSGPDGTYTIRSQYYDSLIDSDLQDNLDGVEEKRKIRARIYSTDDVKAKLEYKCKSGSDGTKYVVNMSREQAALLEQGDFSWLMNNSDELSHFLYQKMIQNIYRPKTIIEYDRTAYTYPTSDTRITFDRDIRTATTRIGLFSKDLTFNPLMYGDIVVFEVKYNDFLIEPIKRIISRHGLLETSNSKYSQARLTYF